MSNNDFVYSRRRFLTQGVGLLSVAGTLPMFLDRSARVMAADFAANPQGAGRSDRVLVVVQLAGGNDGLNTVIPYRNDDYYRARPNLAIPKTSALKGNDEFGFHPSATGFKKLYDAGQMAVLNAVGYPNPNRSHFRSTDIWQTAEPQAAAKAGWLGRYFDSCCAGEDPGHPAPGAAGAATKPAEPNAGIALTGEPPTGMVGEKFIPLVFHSPEDLTHRESSRDVKLRNVFERLNDIDLHDPIDDADHKPMGPGGMPAKIQIPRGTNGSVAAAPMSPGQTAGTGDDTSAFLQRSALNARVYADTIKKSVASIQNKAVYPESRFASELKLVAQMIASGLPTRVYYVQLGGFDTHSQQLNRHVKLMEELAGGMASFVEDLKALGHLDRTTVMTFSEFGRRVTENGSGGTDHGEAAPLFVFGSAVRAGFHGPAPKLAAATLNRGDVPYSLDFRSIYATMLNKWLRADDVKVLGKRFPYLDFFQNLA